MTPSCNKLANTFLVASCWTFQSTEPVLGRPLRQTREPSQEWAVKVLKIKNGGDRLAYVLMGGCRMSEYFTPCRNELIPSIFDYLNEGVVILNQSGHRILAFVIPAFSQISLIEGSTNIPQTQKCLSSGGKDSFCLQPQLIDVFEIPIDKL